MDDHQFLNSYEQVIKEQEAESFIEHVPKHQLQRDYPCHYLSHHGIIKDSLTSPTRMLCLIVRPNLVQTVLV